MKIFSKRTLNLILLNSQLVFHMFWRSHFIFSHENHWVAWSLWIWNISKWNSNIFKNPFHLFKWMKSCHLLSRILYLKRIWIHGDHKCKTESLGKSIYSLSFNFQKVSNFTHFQSINHTINHNKQSKLSIYYNIPKFRILGCYKSNLALIWKSLEVARV